MKLTNQHTKTYFKEVKRVIPVLTSNRNKILSHIKVALNTYAFENPELTYEELVAHFGAPEDIADSILTAEELRTIRLRLVIGKVVACIMLVLCMSFLVYFINQVSELHFVDHGTITLSASEP